MTKILFLHSSSEMYGSDKSLLYLISNLDKSKYTIHVLLPEEGPLVEKLRELGYVKVYVNEMAVLRRKYLSLRGILTYSKQLFDNYRYLLKLVKTEKIDVIYTNTSVVFVGGIVSKRVRIKSIWHVREIIKNKYERKIISFVINYFSDVIISNSIATAKSINAKPSKSRVVYNAVREFENKRKLNSKRYRVGMIGRINRWKGQKLFVDMAKIVLQAVPEAEFVIAGAAYKGEEFLEEELKDYILASNLQNSVKLLGQIDNVEEFYESIDVYVHPSIQPEPFGLVIIEAMDFSLPVVATNHGGPIEIVDEGKTGFLVDYSTPQEMAEKCIFLLENPDFRLQMGENAKNEKRRRFSLSNTVSEIEKIIDEFS